MEIKTYDPSEQVDVAVDLGVLPPPLPEIEFLREFSASVPVPPPQVIEGILHRGCKMILGGTSKSNKSWCLLDLAISVASGERWWGRQCVKSPVVYINFELHVWAVTQRLNALCAATQGGGRRTALPWASIRSPLTGLVELARCARGNVRN